MSREIAQKHKDKLPFIKKQIEQSYKYFQDNYDRFHKFMKFVYDTSLSADDVSKLIVLKKPNIEFNILEAYINRRVGEFSQHEPSLQVRAADGLATNQINDVFIKTIETVEGHIREIIDSTTNDGLETKLYKDTMGGGFSVAEVYTDYVSDMSFEQTIKVDKVFDPTLCGFDPLAVESHKGDGEYCFKIVPKTKEEFEEEFGQGSTKGMTFSKGLEQGSFNWSYRNQEQDILLEVWFYRKERQKEKIAKLSNGHVILAKHYEDLLHLWNDVHQRIEQPPIIIEERWSQIESIWLYRLCEDRILDVKKTNYKYLPLVFFDGNSVTTRRSRYDASYQMTRPYVYQAEGVQRLKNFAGQSMASEIETMVQHKFMVSIESIPEDYVEAYTNPQTAQVLAYNAFYEKNPEMPLPPPQVIQRTDTPTIVQATFEGTDRVTQAILGSFDAQQGIVGDKISGRAIEQGAMQSDASALPYLENYIKGLNRVGQILVDLIPKYYVTPRSIPIRKANGMRDFQVINDPSSENSIDLRYDANTLQIKIEAGVNSSMQKQFALNQITRLMEASELFASFMNADGLEILLENIDIRGIEQLKQRAAQYMDNLRNQPPKPDPMQQAIQVEQERAQGEIAVEAARIEQKRDESQNKHVIDTARIAIEEQKAYNDFIKMIAELEEKRRAETNAQNKEATEMANEAIHTALAIAKHHHEVKNASRETMEGENR